MLSKDVRVGTRLRYVDERYPNWVGAEIVVTECGSYDSYVTGNLTKVTPRMGYNIGREVVMLAGSMTPVQLHPVEEMLE